MYTNICENYQRILERIGNAAKLAGRDPENIHLVVVTKTQPLDVIQSVINAGATDLGENYVEEAIPKIKGFSNNKGLKWHMIGHVQTRKASSVCEYFHYLHSLDSLHLAEKLSRFAVELDKSLPVMLEFNVGGELSKTGWNIWMDENWESILPDVEKIISLPHINLLGVMTIPPYSTDPEVSRPYYRRLRKFKDYISDHFQISGFNELSMGMSGDFEVAIQEGSTWVRIGQAIMGSRIR
jgi:pyridoxal phosphate enzyme (YggS family)